MYVTPNFTTKEAVKRGDTVTIFSPGPYPAPQEGSGAVEGPHYPKPHKWYANVTLKGG